MFHGLMKPIFAVKSTGGLAWQRAEIRKNAAALRELVDAHIEILWTVDDHESHPLMAPQVLVCVPTQLHLNRVGTGHLALYVAEATESEVG